MVGEFTMKFKEEGKKKKNRRYGNIVLEGIVVFGWRAYILEAARRPGIHDDCIAYFIISLFLRRGIKKKKKKFNNKDKS